MPEILKRCTRCGKELPATPEYFYRAKKSKDGLDASCKRCDSTRKGLIYRGAPATPRPGYRFCASCRKELPATTEYFHRDKSCKDGIRYACKDCVHISLGYKERKIASHPVLEGFKQCFKCGNIYEATTQFFHQDLSRPDKLFSYCKTCVLDYGESYRTKNRNTIRKKHRDAYRSDIAAVRYARRLARKRNLPDTLTSTQWERCLVYWQDKCAYCGSALYALSLDHFVPLSSPLCPGTTALNCIPACFGEGGCNQSKGTKPAAEWLEFHYGPRKAQDILEEIKKYFAWVREQDNIP